MYVPSVILIAMFVEREKLFKIAQKVDEGSQKWVVHLFEEGSDHKSSAHQMQMKIFIQKIIKAFAMHGGMRSTIKNQSKSMSKNTNKQLLSMLF